MNESLFSVLTVESGAKCTCNFKFFGFYLIYWLKIKPPLAAAWH